MGFRLNRTAAVVLAIALLGAAPAVASPEAPQEDPSSQLGQFASKLKADGERALAAASEAAARALEQGKAALSGAQEEYAPQVRSFSDTLNEQKAKLVSVGKDAAARFAAWTRSAQESLPDSWTKLWTQSWADVQRSARDALDRFRDWLEDPSISDDKTETPV